MPDARRVRIHLVEGGDRAVAPQLNEVEVMGVVVGVQ